MTPTHERQAAERFNPLNQRARFAEQRAKVIEAHTKNPDMSVQDLATRFRVSTSTVKKLLQANGTKAARDDSANIDRDQHGKLKVSIEKHKAVRR